MTSQIRSLIKYLIQFITFSTSFALKVYEKSEQHSLVRFNDNQVVVSFVERYMLR